MLKEEKRTELAGFLSLNVLVIFQSPVFGPATS
jgi:hypothetical protein